MQPELQLGGYFSRDSIPSGWEVLFDDTQPVFTILKRLTSFVAEKTKCGQQISGEVHPSVVIGPNVIIGKGSVIHAGVLIEGNCIIGEQVEIRHGAYLREDCLIGDRCIIGHSSEVKHAVMLPEASAPHFNYVGDSVLGSGVNIGAGVKLANFRHDGANIVLKVRGEKIDTGIRKFGAILGEGVKLGCNSVTNPGTILGRNCLAYPVSLISGVHPAGTVFKSS